jgi:hypothetical protein
MAWLSKGRIVGGAKTVVFAFVAGYALLLLFVQVGERITRWRAERLLQEMRGLRVGTSTWADLQGIQKRWGAWGRYEGGCDSRHCEYQITLTDWVNRGIGAISYFAQTTDFLRQAAAVGLHDHLPVVLVDVSVRDGVVDETSFMVWTAVPKGDGPGWDGDGPEPNGYVEYKSGAYSLLAMAKSVKGPLTGVYGPESPEHPEYRMRPPDGCEGCMGFNTDFTPAVRPVDLNWLTDFNLYCMTKWSPCTVESELMPAAWGRYVAERKQKM